MMILLVVFDVQALLVSCELGRVGLDKYDIDVVCFGINLQQCGLKGLGEFLVLNSIIKCHPTTYS